MTHRVTIVTPCHNCDTPGNPSIDSVLNVKALVGAFNQEKALVGAFSVIVQPVVEPMEHYTALAEIHLAVPGSMRGGVVRAPHLHLLQ